MTKRVFCLLTIILLAATAHAEPFITFDPPGSGVIYSLSLNSAGDVAGSFGIANNQPIHGFIRDRKGEITVIDVPNAVNTVITAINDRRDVVGYVSDAAASFHMFVRGRNGAVVVVDAPTGYYEPSAVNAGGDVVGTWWPSVLSNTTWSGFRYGRDGTLSVVSVPGETRSRLFDINAAGVAYGIADHTSPMFPFTIDAVGNITRYDVPNANGILFSGSINNRGVVTGYGYINGDKQCFVGDVDQSVVVFAASSGTCFRPSINERGEIAGYGASLNGAGASLLRDADGDITVFAVPGALNTQAYSLNARGEIAGAYYTQSDGKFHCFIRVP